MNQEKQNLVILIEQQKKLPDYSQPDRLPYESITWENGAWSVKPWLDQGQIQVPPLPCDD